MTRSAKIEAFLGEGNFEFQLLVGQLIELEETRIEAMARLGHPVAQGSVMAILSRLESLTAPLVETKAVLRLGLIGAGMDKAAAFNLVERHVQPPDLRPAYLAAYAVLGAAWLGAPNDRPEGEGVGETKGRAKASSSPTAQPAGAGSSGSAARSTTRRKSSKAAASGN